MICITVLLGHSWTWFVHWWSDQQINCVRQFVCKRQKVKYIFEKAPHFVGGRAKVFPPTSPAPCALARALRVNREEECGLIPGSVATGSVPDQNRAPQLNSWATWEQGGGEETDRSLSNYRTPSIEYATDPLCPFPFLRSLPLSVSNSRSLSFSMAPSHFHWKAAANASRVWGECPPSEFSHTIRGQLGDDQTGRHEGHRLNPERGTLKGLGPPLASSSIRHNDQAGK